LCVLCVFVLYSRVSLSSCPFLDKLHCGAYDNHDVLEVTITCSSCYDRADDSIIHRGTYDILESLCNTLQQTATDCNRLQHTATHYTTLQHTATHCNTLQHTATHCSLGATRSAEHVLGMHIQHYTATP